MGARIYGSKIAELTNQHFSLSLQASPTQHYHPLLFNNLGQSSPSKWGKADDIGWLEGVLDVRRPIILERSKVQ